MSQRETTSFYSDLPIHRISLGKLLSDEVHFSEIPSDWHVIVTDIVDSTSARGPSETKQRPPK